MLPVASREVCTACYPFGILDQPGRVVQFHFGEIRPLIPNIYNHLRDWGKKHGHRDGWIYPSTFPWRRLRIGSDGVEVEEEWPASEPKPDVWSVEATHELVWYGPDPGPDRIFPAIIINAMGWAFGNRVQFDDWRIDGRVRWKCLPSFGLHVVHLRYFLDRVVETVLQCPPRQVEILNTLILHNRVRMYHWEWERFQWQYAALDSCWKLLQYRNLVPTSHTGGHANRIAIMCERLGIPRLVAVESRVVMQRNDLVHQGLWCGGIPGYKVEQEPILDILRIEKLVDRLLLHFFDIDCELRTQSWDVGALLTESMGMSSHVPRDIHRIS